MAINNGVNRVESNEFITSKNVVDENFELLKEAFTNAKQIAEILSAQGGFVINGVKKIDIQQNNGNLPIPTSYHAFNSNSITSQKTLSTQIKIIPQENNLIVDLSVPFYIENKVH